MTTETVRLDALVGQRTALDEACYANEEAEQELAQLRADAARYRWLRTQHWHDNTITAVRYPKDAIKLGHDAPTGERLDDMIDEAASLVPNKD